MKFILHSSVLLPVSAKKTSVIVFFIHLEKNNRLINAETGESGHLRERPGKPSPCSEDLIP